MKSGGAIIGGLVLGAVIGYTWSQTLGNYQPYVWLGNEINSMSGGGSSSSGSGIVSSVENAATSFWTWLENAV